MDTLVELKAVVKTPAYAAQSAKSPLAPWSIQRLLEPRAHDVLIDILYCGVCHSDLHQVARRVGATSYPMVPGHGISAAGRWTRTGMSRNWKKGDLARVGCLVDS